jgi:membrane protein
MVKKVFQEVSKIWVAERPTQLAAALAFASMFSFAPVIFIAYTVVEFFANRIEIDTQFYERMQGVLGGEIATLISNSVEALTTTNSSQQGSIIISIISFLALLFTASGVFFQLQFALNRVWQVTMDSKAQAKSYVRQRVFSFVIVIGVGVLGIVAILANLVLTWFGSFLARLLSISTDPSLLAGISLVVIIFLVCALFYKFLPETDVAWGDVWLGAGVTTTLLLTAITLISLFFRYTSPSSALQAAGGFSILMLGFYYIAQIFLLGAIVCRVYASLIGSRKQKEDESHQPAAGLSE